MSERLLVVSPHLDDAALSCTWLLAQHPRSTVLTLYAGHPPNAELITPWDRECGFAGASQAIRNRQREDAQALQRLGAQAVWLDGVDGQYGEWQAEEHLESGIRGAFRARPELRPVVPLGLHHPDHADCAQSSVRALRAIGRIDTVWMYEDVPYRRIPHLVDARVAALKRAGLRLRPPREYTGALSLKRDVLREYASQWPRLVADPLLEFEDAFAPERIWSAEFA